MFQKLSFFLFFIFSLHGLFAQTDHSNSNLFEYGDSVVSSEDNLKNLFTNFPRYIDDAEIIQLIDYEYAGVVKNRRQARRYVKENFKAPAFNVSHSLSANGTVDENKQPGDLYSSSVRLEDDNTMVKLMLQKMVNEYAGAYIKSGYQVYAVRFAYQAGIFRYYVFINPDNKKVVTYLNLFGFSIPG